MVVQVERYRGSILNSRFQNVAQEDVFCSDHHEPSSLVCHPKFYRDKRHFNFAAIEVKPAFIAPPNFLTYPLLNIGSTPYELLMKIRAANFDPNAGCRVPYSRDVFSDDSTTVSYYGVAPMELQGIPFREKCIRMFCESEFNKHLHPIKTTKYEEWQNETEEWCTSVLNQGPDSMSLCVINTLARTIDSAQSDRFTGFPVLLEGIALGMISRPIHHITVDFWYVQTYLRVYPWLSGLRESTYKNLGYDPILQHYLDKVPPDLIIPIRPKESHFQEIEVPRILDPSVTDGTVPSLKTVYSRGIPSTSCTIFFAISPYVVLKSLFSI
ncbi:Hypothetical protein NTJ_08839 [Nesidiocoris tenuis]|uniref:Uncharacterized protein n=1 Tax=Nesidiocoris tenuis TaxID=355587 RepID=A0ABN7AXI7_9HEMI|nr:Hypothetical protein NTJ_08839 [Nesidiocoris tenuis]